MSNNGIKLSKKHGLNPSLEKCFFCGKDKGIILFGELKDDQEAPREVVLNMEPCNECKELMKKGVMLIEVKDVCDPKNPYRTGVMVLVRDEAINHLMEIDPENKEALEEALEQRFLFIPKSILEAILGDNYPEEEEDV